MSLPAPEAKRRRHTRQPRTLKVTTPPVEDDAPPPPPPPRAPVSVTAVPFVNTSTAALMDDLFGPIVAAPSSPPPEATTVLSGLRPGDDDSPLPNNNTPPSLVNERTLILESMPEPESRLRTRIDAVSPLAQMAQAAAFPLEPAVERIARRLASPTQVPRAEFYVVRGLSDLVPSDAYERTRLRQAELQSQINDLEHGAQQWSVYDQFVNTAMLRMNSRARERAAECFRRLSAQFVPQPTVLKPASVSRALNAKWRALLLGELQALRHAYLVITTVGLVPTTTEADIDAVAEQYVAALVDPMVQQQIGVIGRSNYDESPLMWSTLRDFFDSYLAQAAEYLNLPRAEQARLVPSPEALEMTCFIANALELYAQPEFLRAWLPAWLARNPQPPAVEQTLTAYIKRIVAHRQAELEARTVPSYVAFYTPMTEDDARAAYRTMLESDVALLRARLAANNARVRSAIVTYFNTPTAAFLQPAELVYTMPRNTFELVDEVLGIVRQDIAVAYAPRAGDMPEMLESVATQRAAELAAIAEHAALLEQRLALYGLTRERVGASTAPHGPADGADAAGDGDKWSPYDLSYPLEPEASEAQIERLVTTVARSAQDFDAREQQTRAHEIRRAIDRNYTLQVMERRRADLQWQLEQLTVRTADVPQRVEHDIFDQQVVRLVVSIGLSPQLEKRILTMNETLLDPEERRAQDALATQRFRVTWFFKPTGNGTPSGTPEVVVRDQVLDRGHLTDVYMPFAPHVDDDRPGGLNNEQTVLALIRESNARAGIYRVEVRRVDLGDESPVYASLFKATIVTVARCMRDNKLFEPLNSGESAERHTCCWRQAAPNREFTEYVEELRALVEHGPRAHRALLEQRQKSSIALWEHIAALVAKELPNETLPLPLPPWGSSVPSELVRTSYESQFTFQRRFSFDAIYADFRRRVGVLLYYLVRQSPATLARFPAITKYRPEQLFNFYLDATLRSVDGVARVRELAAEYGIFRPRAAVRANEAARDDVPTSVAVENLLAMAARAVDSFETTPDMLTPPQAALTVTPTIDLVRSEPTLISDESMLSILQRLAHPLAQAMMTERERAFFGGVAREFTAFSRLYRRKKQLDAPLLRAECTTRMPFGVESVAAAGLTDAIDVCVDAELGAMTVEQIERELEPGERAASGVPRMFFDAASYAEYRRLMQNCVQGDDFAQLMRDRQRIYDRKLFNGGVDIRFAHLEREPVGQCCLDALALPGYDGVPTWIGAHSAVTDQPVPLVLQFSGETPLGEGLFKRAALAHAGSQPTHRNVDFNGLRHLVEAACARYNTVVDELERGAVTSATPVDVRASVVSARGHAEQLALVYNYFAFAAPPIDKHFDAHGLVREIMHGTRFRALSFVLPL